MGLSTDPIELDEIIESDEPKSGRVLLKGETKIRKGIRRLNYKQAKRTSDRSKYNEWRLETPEDVEKKVGESDIFANTVKGEDVLAADEVSQGPLAAPEEISEDVVSYEVSQVPLTPPEEISEDVMSFAPEEDSADAEVMSFAPEEDSADVEGASPPPNEESEDAAMNLEDEEVLYAGDNGLPNEDEYSKTGAPTFAPIATETTTPPVPMPTTASGSPTVATGAPTIRTLSPTIYTMAPTVPVERPSYDEFVDPTNAPTSIFFEMPSGDELMETGAPTFVPPPKKKTYAPAYNRPLATPRPTNSAPSAKPTRRPSKLTDYPTGGPTVSAAPSSTPSVSAQPSEKPSEKTVSPTVPGATSAPTTSPSVPPTALPTELPTQPETFDRSVCVSDENGGYGIVAAPVTLAINYRFQVEATSTYTIDDLNNEALPEAEKGFSDVLVPRLFFPNGECDDDTVAQARGGASTILSLLEEEDEAERKSAQKWALGFHDAKKEKPKGGRTTGWETPSGHRWLLKRELQEDDRLFGLSATPPDIVIRGRLANACPSPVGGTGPDGQPLICWVIQGGITLFGSGDFSWADGVVQEALDVAMASGKFDNGAINSNVIYVRSISPGTILNVTVDQVKGVDEDDGGETPVWAWVLIALGILGLLLALTYLILKRRQQRQEFERQRAETESLAAGDAARGRRAVPG